MNEYQLSELAQMAMSNFLATLGVFLSIVTAYIVATFVAARRLNALQLSIVNLSFVVSAGILGYLAVSNFRVFYIFVSLNAAGPVQSSPNKPVLIDFTWPLSILLLGIVIGSVVFMVSARREPKK